MSSTVNDWKIVNIIQKEKEETTNTSHNMDEFQNLYTKEKKLYSKST